MYHLCKKKNDYFVGIKILSTEIVDKWMKKVRERSIAEGTDGGKLTQLLTI